MPFVWVFLDVRYAVAQTAVDRASPGTFKKEMSFASSIREVFKDKNKNNGSMIGWSLQIADWGHVLLMVTINIFQG